MAVKLHRCPNLWVKIKGHPCWRLQKALDDKGIAYEIVKGPWPQRKTRDAVIRGTGKALYPAIEFEDGSWYRAESKEMERVIREDRLMAQSAHAKEPGDGGA
jgi:hypothetical protein